MPTMRIQPIVKLPLTTASTRKEVPADNWIHIVASLLPPGTFTRDVSFPTKETLLFMSAYRWPI